MDKPNIDKLKNFHGFQTVYHPKIILYMLDNPENHNRL
jgi:hypothetical protein